MQTNEFYQARQADWQKLTHLLDRCQNGLEKLSAAEVQSLGQLYRAATSDLALAQRDFPGQRVALYLNQLVARAHAIIYHSEPLALNRLTRFVTIGLPRLYRELWPFTLAAALFFIIPALVAGFGTAWQPTSARWLLPASAQNLIPTIENHELWIEMPVNERPYISTFIMQNNIQVAFLAFSGGVLVMALTVWVMITNGLVLGGLTGLTAHYGIGFELWNFVIGHGVIELSVIVMAGGAGLSLGWAILRPGLRRRRDALALAARKAVRLIIASVPLLILAGLIEGFISPAENIPWPIKWGVGLGSGLVLYGYWFFGGREKAKK